MAQPRAVPAPGADPAVAPPDEKSYFGPPGHSFCEIEIYPGSMISSVRGPVLQRQPAPGTSTAAPTAADNIRDAIQLLYPVQPAMIFEALSAVTVNGGSTLVRAVPLEEAGKPITTLFTLEVKVAALTGHTKALFEGPAKPAQPDPTTRTYAMTITVSPTVAQTVPQALARDLFHEGMHMQLFMDRALPAERRSTQMTRMSEYQNVAEVNNDYASLLADLTTYIAANPSDKLKPVRRPKRAAKEIVEHMIEEKFVVDETNRSSLSPKPSAEPSAAEVSKSYLSMTTRWLVTYLGDYGVSTADTATVASLAARLKSIWLSLDSGVSKPTVQIGMYGDHEPDLLAPPQPAGF
jgi:hypothetical protein